MYHCIFHFNSKQSLLCIYVQSSCPHAWPCWAQSWRRKQRWPRRERHHWPLVCRALRTSSCRGSLCTVLYCIEHGLGGGGQCSDHLLIQLDLLLGLLLKTTFCIWKWNVVCETIPWSFSKLSKVLDGSDGNSGVLQRLTSQQCCGLAALAVAPRENMVSFEFSCYKKFFLTWTWKVGDIGM